MGGAALYAKIREFYEQPTVLCSDVVANVNGKQWLTTSESSDSAELLENVIADVWISIMRNLTIVRLATTDDCENVFERHVVDDGMQIKLLNIMCKECSYVDLPMASDTENAYWGFISCSASRRLGWLQFSEVLKVIDKWIWLSIFASVGLASTISRILGSGRYPMYNSITSIAKLLLEQGNPFAESVEKNCKLKMLLTTLLLMGVILSNAYKNTNVYNMIAPRFPIPYEKLDELQQDNFTIYGVVTINEIFNGEESFAVGSDIAESEIVETLVIPATNYTIPIYFFLKHWFEQERNDTKIQFHKGIMNEFQAHLEAHAEEFSIVDWAGRHLFWVDQYYWFHEIQERLLTQSLQACEKVALILPQRWCWELRSKVENLPSGHHIFVGKEHYSEVYDVYYLEGLISSSITRRVKAIGESGIWEWQRMVVQAISRSQNNVEKERILEPPNMYGNILIVFIIWLGGILFAAIFNFGENCLQFCRFSVSISFRTY